MTHFPIGTLVRHRYFEKRTLGIVKSVDVFHSKVIMTVAWFSSLEDTMDEIWELINIEEIDNDEQF